MIRKLIVPICMSLVFMCNENKEIIGYECKPILTPIEVVYPKGGETFRVGDTKTIQWKVNPQTVEAVQQVQVQISLDDEKTWKEVYERGIAVTDTGSVECMSATWIIGSEYSSVNYNSTNSVTLRVGKYGSPDAIFDSSEKYTVVK